MMMRKIVVTLVAAIIGGAVAYAGSSNTNYTSAGTVGFRTTTDGTTNCVGTTACNLANVTIWDSAAGANGLAVNASGQIGINNFPAIQTVSQSGTWTVNPTTPNNWGVGQAGVGTPSNGVLGLMDNAGTSSALKGDPTNGLWVNIKAGAGSGGTAIADKATWTASTTQFTLTGGEFTTGGATACTTGQSCTVAMTADRGMFANLSDVGGTPLTAAVSAYGTAPTGTAVMGVNAFITNASTPVGPSTATQSPVMAGTQNSSAQITSSTNTTTPLIAVSGSTKVYIMAWDVIAAGASTVQLVYGTGATCTGATPLTGVYPLAAQAGISKGDGSAPVLIAPASQGVCIVTGGTASQVSGSITYQQF